MSKEKIIALDAQICGLKGVHPNVAGERKKALLQWERDALQAERTLAISRKAILLFNAYFDTCQMTATRHDGMRRVGLPCLDVHSDVQMLWNVIAEAENLADWATP